MARCLIVACGCRGLQLTRALRTDGHAVRATTRDPGRVAELEAAGAEAVVGDPDRFATLARTFDHVGVVLLLLGSARGSDEQLRALHTTRLDMLMERMLDTTVRAVVFEAAGSVAPEILAAGTDRVRHWCQRSLIPLALLDTDPIDHAAWGEEALGAVRASLGAAARL